MLKKLLLTGAAASGLLFASAASAAPILLIDNFDDPLSAPGSMIMVQSGETKYDLSTGAGILDEDRELVLRHLDENDDTVIFAQITNNGRFKHNNGDEVPGSSLLRWDGQGGNNTPDSDINDADPETLDLDFGLNGGAGYDLSDGSLEVHISVTSADLAGGQVFMRLYTDGGNWAERMVVLGAGPSEHFLDLTGFEDAAFQMAGQLDLNFVRAIELLVVGNDSLDISLDIIEVVPEPISVGLFGLGLLGAAAIRRRRATN